MTDKFVGIPERTADDFFIIENDGVLKSPPLSQPSPMELRDVFQEPESPGRGDLGKESFLGQGKRMFLPADQRMGKIN